MEKPKQRWWAVAETFSDSVNIQQRKVWELVTKSRIKYGKYDEINGFTNRKLLFDNGSIVIFKSYDQEREAFQGEDVDGIWNDEEPPYSIYKEQKMRLLDRNGEMVISMTSLRGVTDLIQDLFEDHDVIEKRTAPLLGEEIPTVCEKNGIRFYMLWTTDNPHIDQERVRQEIAFLTKDEIKSRIYGLPVNLSGKIYLSFSKRIHVVPFDFVPREKVTLYHVLDPHDRKPWAMQWWAVHTTGTAYCVDEYPNRDFNEMTSDDKTYDDYKQIINTKEAALKEIFRKSVQKRIIDPNFGNKTIQLAKRQGGQAHTTPKKELLARGFKFTDGIDALEAGHLKIREVLDWKEVEGEIVKQPQCLFVDHCTNSIKHHSRYSRKDIMAADGDVKDSVKPMDKYKDFCDLSRYFWMSNPRHFVPQPFNDSSEGKRY